MTGGNEGSIPKSATEKRAILQHILQQFSGSGNPPARLLRPVRERVLTNFTVLLSKFTYCCWLII
ncbi:hypothetical protein H1P_5440002 [Hyella patelloides LEGE 07179]|uniref:Uncharacterized protein n=1 Tax=Hyella patelloides LEGE 07179 TaxID=945734 RepID=A0A563W088_9CYAN|nr:hypothetical protein H1P_5440002 [Hyella patelloides LEGE 07179]